MLATRTLGPAEIARHEHDAWLTPVADPIALADAMQLLLSDAALRAELAANGKAMTDLYIFDYDKAMKA